MQLANRLARLRGLRGGVTICGVWGALCRSERGRVSTCADPPAEALHGESGAPSMQHSVAVLLLLRRCAHKVAAGRSR